MIFGFDFIEFLDIAQWIVFNDTYVILEQHLGDLVFAQDVFENINIFLSVEA